MEIRVPLPLDGWRAVVIVDLDGQGWAHLRLALQLHARWCRENAIAVPDETCGVFMTPLTPRQTRI